MSSSGVLLELIFFRPNRSIKGILISSLLFLVIAPIVILGFFTLEEIEKSLENDVMARNHVMARSLAVQVDEILSRAEKVIGVTGQLARNSLAAPEDLNAVLSATVDSFPAFSHLLILDGNGIIRHSSRKGNSWIGYDFSQHSHFIETVKQTGSFWWSLSHIPIRGKAPTLAVGRNFGDLLMFGYMDLARLSRNVEALSREVGVRAAVLDRNANVTACSEPGKAEQRLNLLNLPFVRKGLRGEFKTGRRPDENGSDAIVSVAEIKTASLFAVIFQDADRALAVVSYVRKVFLLTLSLACIIAIVVMTYIFRHIKGPLTAFSNYTDQVADGRYELMAGEKRLAEFRTLELNFLRMAKAVSARETDLKQALEEVKQLSGLLPICAKCKKIRDDKGYWNDLESYIQDHSNVSFSHGLCTECSDQLYGQQRWYKKMKQEKH